MLSFEAQTIKKQLFKKHFILMLVLLVAIFLYWKNDESISGTYIEKTEQSISMIRLVESKNGKLLGQIQEVTLDKDGKIQNFSGELEGYRDKENLILRLNISTLITSPITLSGTYKKDKIILTSGIYNQAAETSEYKLDRLETFELASAELKEGSIKILDKELKFKAMQRMQKQQEDVIQNAIDLTKSLQAVSLQIKSTPEKLLKNESKHREITELLQTLHNQAQKESATTISAILIEMKNAIFANDNIYRDTTSEHHQYLNKMLKLSKDYKAAKDNCNHFSKKEILLAGCVELQKEAKAFHNILVKIQSASDSYEKTYRQELEIQKKLINSVEQL